MAKLSSTQELSEIEQIREGIVILKNRGLRGIMMVSSLNFALKSEDEQTALLYQFQNFLNSLDFSCQIIIQSRKLNITGYIEKLKEVEKNQKNELLRIQTAGYREFIESIVTTGTIMTKNFYIVVPFSLLEAKNVSTKELLKTSRGDVMTEQQFQRCKAQLWQRMEFLALGLRRCGLRAAPLNSSEIIELFWALNHPKQAEVGYYPEIPPELVK